MNYPLHLPLVFLPSPEASLAVTNSRPSRELLCHVEPHAVHDEQCAVAVASDGIAEQIFFTMGSPLGHDRPQAHVFFLGWMRCSHGRPKDPSVFKPPL